MVQVAQEDKKEFSKEEEETDDEDEGKLESCNQATFMIGASDEDFEDFADNQSRYENFRVIPPDGGWGWIVVLCSFLCNVMVDGIIFTSGLLLPYLKDYFHVSMAQASWICSLLSGFYLLAGPFVSSFSNAFGFRPVCIIGAIIAGAGCGASYYANSIVYLYVTFGLVGGIGFGFIYVPAVIATGFYFEQKRALATGIAVCGSGIGTFALSPFCSYVLEKYGWQDTMLAYMGLILSCILFGMAFRPLTATTGKKVAEDDFQTPGTPLLLRIKRVRDEQLRQCASALSMSSFTTSRSPSGTRLDEYLLNGEVKPICAAKAIMERHGTSGIQYNRHSFQGIIFNPPEVIIEEVEPATSSSENQEIGSIPNTKLDSNKNETTVHNSTPVAHPKGRCPRIESAPVLPNQHRLSVGKYNFLSIYQDTNCLLVENYRRTSKVALRTERSRPFYRDDIFYSGSLYRLPQYTEDKLTDYHASVTHLPDDVLSEDEDEKGCCNCRASSLTSVLSKMFDFSLLSSVTFIILGISGFLSLLALFVPFTFLPSYIDQLQVVQQNRTDIPKTEVINDGVKAFIMSLIGICNTVGRILCGWISDHPKVDALVVNNVALITGGIATMLLPFLSNVSLLYAYGLAFGLSVGKYKAILELSFNCVTYLAAFASLRSILIVELLGLEKLTNAFGLLLLFQGIAALFGSPIAGSFIDATNSYEMSFYIFGGIFALSGVLCIPLRYIKKWEDGRRQRKKKNFA